MPNFKTTIGNVEITSLSDGYLGFPTGDFFPSVPSEAWEPYKEYLNSDGNLSLNMASFLLRSDGKTVLIDTGLGADSSNFQDAKSGLLIKDLKDKGIGLDEVDIVIMTHLHPDHVGWNFSQDGEAKKPTFPKARYYAPEADWKVFTRMVGMGNADHVRDSVMPLEELGLLELFEGEQALTSEVTTLPTPGHTPGHTSILISSNGEKGIITGDATHTPVQTHETAWSPRADRDATLSTASRHKIMDHMEQENGLFISGHYPSPGFGRLVRLEGRRYWQAL